jgi:hypothetical protein
MSNPHLSRSDVRSICAAAKQTEGVSYRSWSVSSALIAPWTRNGWGGMTSVMRNRRGWRRCCPGIRGRGIGGMITGW